MSQTDSIGVKVELKYSTAEKFYGFFRNKLGDLVNMFPQEYKSIELVEGETFCAGSVVLFHHELGGQPFKVKSVLRVVDDVKKYIVYEVIEGDPLKNYKEINLQLEVINGALNKAGGSFAKWTIEFVKANENVPPPQTFLGLLEKITKGVDVYFSNN